MSLEFYLITKSPLIYPSRQSLFILGFDLTQNEDCLLLLADYKSGLKAIKERFIERGITIKYYHSELLHYHLKYLS